MEFLIPNPLMREYELFYLVGETKEAELPALRTAIEKIFTKEGATFLPAETSDKRKLAYPVQGEYRGTYIARRFTLPDKTELTSDEFEKAVGKKDTLAVLTRELSLEKNILRSLILRADELPELKPIERTEYAKKEVRGRTGGRTAAPCRPAPMKDAPLLNQDKEAAPVSAEKIDKQLEEVLDI